jgi:putative cellulose-binding protein
MANHERALAVANDKLTEAQAEAVRVLEEAHASAEDERERAATEAKSRLENARVAAERVKRESERELSALAARRDSITEQLANVRQMLSTLGGSALAMNLSPSSPASPSEAAVDEGAGKKISPAKATAKAK